MSKSKDMLLVVTKIDKVAQRDENGAIMTHPLTRKKIFKFKLVEEAVDVTMIKGIREFHRSGKMYREFEGDLTVIYFRTDDKVMDEDSDTERERTYELHAIGNWKQIVNDVNKLRSGEKIIVPTDSVSQGTE